VRTGGAGASAWHLALAGPPVTERYKGRLEQLIAHLALTDKVTWTGMLAGADKWAALRAADALALPSHQENFGVVVAEALGCGVPVLISNKVNIWREVLGDGAGLVEPDDQAGTDRLLASWAALGEPDRARMRMNARQCFVRRFDVRNTAKQLAAFLAPLAVDPR
jgi:glycosyltransferase involved in cell wall biosynthesis